MVACEGTVTPSNGHLEYRGVPLSGPGVVHNDHGMVRSAPECRHRKYQKIGRHVTPKSLAQEVLIVIYGSSRCRRHGMSSHKVP